jgi:hypothetical protein
MILALLLTLAVVAASARPAVSGPVLWPPEGCPRGAIAFYRYTPAKREGLFGMFVGHEEFGGGTFVNGGEHTERGITVLHFYRDARLSHAAPVAAIAEVDPETHALRARVGSVRKVLGQWCMFSAPPPIAPDLLKQDY